MAFDLDNDDVDDTLGSLNVPDWVPPSDPHGSGGSGGGWYEPVLTPIDNGSYGSGGGSIVPVDPYLGPPQQGNENEPLPNSTPAAGSGPNTPATSAPAETLGGFDGNTILIGAALVIAAIVLLGGNDK